MNVGEYLGRIAYDGPSGPSADTLRQLHVAHMLAVPFENLSIHRREPIVLEERALFDKIVVRRRGGFCYELNGLFAWLLRSLGFRVDMLAAEVRNAPGEWGPPFDHMALLVVLDEPWLADVGFGDSFLAPLRLHPDLEHAEGSTCYRVNPADGRWIMARRVGDGDWIPQFRFDPAPHALVDFDEMCRYHQTSPDSHFTRNRVCSLATKDGRLTLSGTRLITTSSDSRVETELAGDAAYFDTLREHFGIALPAPVA